MVSQSLGSLDIEPRRIWAKCHHRAATLPGAGDWTHSEL